MPGIRAIRPASALAYTTDSRWRNRSEFLQGREAIEAFLTRNGSANWTIRLIKEVWAFHANRIAVRFAYEWPMTAGIGSAAMATRTGSLTTLA